MALDIDRSLKKFISSSSSKIFQGMGGGSNYFSSGGLRKPSPNNIQNAKKYIVDGKPIYYFGKKQNAPPLHLVQKVYAKIPDDKKAPVIFQTKREYLKEYIQNQEQVNGVNFSNREKQQYIKRELKEMKPVVSRFTTYHNQFMEPRTVFFTDNKYHKDSKNFETSALHEYWHEKTEAFPHLQDDEIKAEEYARDKVSNDLYSKNLSVTSRLLDNARQQQLKNIGQEGIDLMFYNVGDSMQNPVPYPLQSSEINQKIQLLKQPLPQDFAEGLGKRVSLASGYRRASKRHFLETGNLQMSAEELQKRGGYAEYDRNISNYNDESKNRLNKMMREKLYDVGNIGYTTKPSITPRPYQYSTDNETTFVSKPIWETPESVYEKSLRNRAENIIKRYPNIITEASKIPGKLVFYQGPKNPLAVGQYVGEDLQLEATKDLGNNTNDKVHIEPLSLVDLRPKNFNLPRRGKDFYQGQITFHELKHAQDEAANIEEYRKQREIEREMEWNERLHEQAAQKFALEKTKEVMAGQPIAGPGWYATPEEELYQMPKLNDEEYNKFIQELELRRQLELRDVEERKTAGIQMLDNNDVSKNMVFKHHYGVTSVADKNVKTVLMNPEDFLKTTHQQSQLSSGSPYQSYEDYKAEILRRSSIDWHKKAIPSKRMQVEIPFLEFDKWGRPKGHEGRHTSQAAVELGLKEIPVTIEQRRYSREWEKPPYPWQNVSGSNVKKLLDLPAYKEQAVPSEYVYTGEYKIDEEKLEREKKEYWEKDERERNERMRASEERLKQLEAERKELEDSWTDEQKVDMMLLEAQINNNDSSKDKNQLYLSAKNLPKPKNAHEREIKEYLIEREEEQNKKFINAPYMVTLPYTKDITFLGKWPPNMDFDKEENITHLSNLLTHEELHSILDEQFPKENENDEESVSKKLDNISIPRRFITNNEETKAVMMNPLSANTINIPVAKITFDENNPKYDAAIFMGEALHRIENKKQEKDRSLPIKEDWNNQQLRTNRGYIKLVQINAQKFKEEFEKEHQQKLAWNKSRSESLADVEVFDAHPQINFNSILDVNDGRHRINRAAEQGDDIVVAVKGQHIVDKLLSKGIVSEDQSDVEYIDFNDESKDRLNYMQKEKLKNVAIGYTHIPSQGTNDPYEEIPLGERIMESHILEKPKSKYQAHLRNRAMNILKRYPTIISEAEKNPASLIFYEGPEVAAHKGVLWSYSENKDEEPVAMIDINVGKKYSRRRMRDQVLARGVFHELRHGQQFEENPVEYEKRRIDDEQKNIPHNKRQDEIDAELYSIEKTTEVDKYLKGEDISYLPPNDVRRLLTEDLTEEERDEIYNKIPAAKLTAALELRDNRRAGMQMLDEQDESKDRLYSVKVTGEPYLHPEGKIIDIRNGIPLVEGTGHGMYSMDDNTRLIDELRFRTEPEERPRMPSLRIALSGVSTEEEFSDVIASKKSNYEKWVRAIKFAKDTENLSDDTGIYTWQQHSYNQYPMMRIKDLDVSKNRLNKMQMERLKKIENVSYVPFPVKTPKPLDVTEPGGEFKVKQITEPGKNTFEVQVRNRAHNLIKRYPHLITEFEKLSPDADVIFYQYGGPKNKQIYGGQHGGETTTLDKQTSITMIDVTGDKELGPDKNYQYMDIANTAFHELGHEHQFRGTNNLIQKDFNNDLKGSEKFDVYFKDPAEEEAEMYAQSQVNPIVKGRIKKTRVFLTPEEVVSALQTPEGEIEQRIKTKELPSQEELKQRVIEYQNQIEAQKTAGIQMLDQSKNKEDSLYSNEFEVLKEEDEVLSNEAKALLNMSDSELIGHNLTEEEIDTRLQTLSGNLTPEKQLELKQVQQRVIDKKYRQEVKRQKEWEQWRQAIENERRRKERLQYEQALENERKHEQAIEKESRRIENERRKKLINKQENKKSFFQQILSSIRGDSVGKNREEYTDEELWKRSQEFRRKQQEENEEYNKLIQQLPETATVDDKTYEILKLAAQRNRYNDIEREKYIQDVESHMKINPMHATVFSVTPEGINEKAINIFEGSERETAETFAHSTENYIIEDEAKQQLSRILFNEEYYHNLKPHQKRRILYLIRKQTAPG